jgi:hypothetical protein
MAQQNIDFGTFPDDPSADAIRTAFQKVQTNFDQLFSTNANSTVNSINRTPGAGITVNYPTGNVVISANIACLLVATTSLKVGRGSDNTQSNVTITSSSQTLNIDIDPAQVLSNTFAATGSGLANLNGTLTSNSYYQPNINTVGTLTSLSVTGNANITGNASFTRNANFTGNYINFSNVSNLHIQGGSLGYYLQTDGTGNLTWAAGGGGGNGSPGGVNTYVQFNDEGNFGANLGFTFDKVTGVLTVPSLEVTDSANIGNLVGALANGNSNVNIPVADGNVNISVDGTDNVFVVTGDGANLLGNLTVGNADLGNLATASYFTGTLTTAAQPNITSVGTLASLSVTGNVSSGNANLGNLATASYFSGNGIFISNIAGANVSGTVANATYATSTGSAGSATTAGTVTTAAQPNITSVGTLVSLTVTGNITSGNASLGNLASATYFSGDGSLLTNITGANVTGNVGNALNAYAVSGSNVSGQVGNALVAGTVYTAAQPNITSTGTLAGLTGTGTINFTGASNVALGPVANVHITGGSTGQVLTTDGAGVLTWVSISSSSISNGTSNVSIPATDGNVVIGVSGNAAILTVTGTGANVSGYLNVGSGAITGGNITAGNIAGGNLVSANYISGNGSYLSGIAGANVVGNVTSAVQSHYANIANSVAGSNVSGQVGNALVAGTVYTNAQPNITSVGTLTSLAVTGNTISGNVLLNGGLTSNRTDVAVTTNTIIDQFPTGTYRTAKYIISASGDDGYQSVESILVHDGTSSYISIYGSVCSNVSADIVELSSNIASGNVRVYATSASVNANVNLLVTYLKT